jgi:hypothetical protein
MVPSADGVADGSFSVLPQPLLYDTLSAGNTIVPAKDVRTIQVGGTNGMPIYGVGGAVLTVTVQNQTATGGLYVWPSESDRPASPQLQFTRDEVGGTTTTVIVTPGVDGNVTLQNISLEPIHVRINAQGWFLGNRAIPASQEDAFVANAVALGYPEAYARLAVWDASFAALVPQTAQSTGTVQSEAEALAEGPLGFEDDTTDEREEAETPPGRFATLYCS